MQPSADSVRKTFAALAVLLSALALLLAAGVGRWQVVPAPHDSSIEARYRTHLSLPGTLAIVRQPVAGDFHRGHLESLPVFNPGKAQTLWQVDLRGRDLSQLDISNRLADLLHADFDTKTRWPAPLPSGFDPARIMQLGKDPGLGVRVLHAKGITGKGVSVGIIDSSLLVDHIEYRDRLRLYEEIHNFQGEAEMHGPAVASIAVGKTVGVAPEVDLYYIAETPGVFLGNDKYSMDFTSLAQSINRLLDVSATLPEQNRIRVISLSVGWHPLQTGYAEVTAAVKRAKKEGVFVISTSLGDTHNLLFHGLGREPMADPNTFALYTPGSWWAREFWDGSRRFAPGKRLLVPMDARCTASPTGTDDYVFYVDGGWSWSVPWIAGFYALACQVKPDITPEQFWAEALKTGETIPLRKDGADIQFGIIANPVALMEHLRK